MSEYHNNHLLWNDSYSPEQVGALLDEFGRVEIELPPDFHHALFRRFHPEDGNAGPERVDEEGDPSLLERVTAIRGLAELEVFRELLEQRHARVKVLSPGPLLVFIAPHHRQ